MYVGKWVGGGCMGVGGWVGVCAAFMTLFIQLNFLGVSGHIIF